MIDQPDHPDARSTRADRPGHDRPGDPLDELTQALGAVPASSPNEALRSVLGGRSLTIEPTDLRDPGSPIVTTLQPSPTDHRRGRIALLAAVAAAAALIAIGLSALPSRDATLDPASVADEHPTGSREVGVVPVGEAGFVAIDLVDGRTLDYLSADLEEGWIVIESAITDELVELRFTRNDLQVDLRVEVVDGGMSAHVRYRPDGEWVEVGTDPRAIGPEPGDPPRPVSTTAPTSSIDEPRATTSAPTRRSTSTTEEPPVSTTAPVSTTSSSSTTTTDPAVPTTSVVEDTGHPDGYTNCTSTPTTMEGRPCLPVSTTAP